MALTSPGVEVSVIDESFYTPAAAATVPLIIVATAANKPNGAGTGTAQGTVKSNAGTPYLITSQRELTETFGNPTFYTDSSNNPLHGNELNEYGLQSAYSFLGVANRAYIVRADAAVAASNIAGRCNLNNHGSHKNGTSIVTLDIQADNDGRAFRIIRSAEVPNQEDLAAAGADIVVVFNNRATLWTRDA